MTTTLTECPPASDRAAAAAFYEEHGYYVARGVADAATLAPLVRDFDRVIGQMRRTSENLNARWKLATTAKLDSGAGSVVIHTHQIQKYSGAYAQWLFNDDFLDPVENLIGPDIILHHSKLFLKPAGRGAAFPPHQDYGYFRTTAHSMLAAVLYLSRSDESNGCLRVWPGSHKLGPIDPKLSMGGSAAFAKRFPFEESIPVLAEAGDVVIFNYLTVHGSLANRGRRSRKSVLFQMHSGKDKMEDNVAHPNSNLVLRGWNHHMTRERANAD